MKEDNLFLHTYRLKRKTRQPAAVASDSLLQIEGDDGTESFIFPPAEDSLGLQEDTFGLYEGAALDLPLPRGLRRVTSPLPGKMKYWDEAPEMVANTAAGAGPTTVKLITLLKKKPTLRRGGSENYTLAPDTAGVDKIRTNSAVINAFECTGTGYPCIVLCMTRAGTKDFVCLEWDHHKYYPGVMAEFAARREGQSVSEDPIYLLPGVVRDESDPFGVILKTVYVALTTEAQRIEAVKAIEENDNDFHLSKWEEVGELEGVGIVVDPQFGLRPCQH